MSKHLEFVEGDNSGKKTIPLVPNKCPINQCGGFMFAKERKPPEKDMEEYNGDWQTPDLVCYNCGAIYSFQRFKNGKAIK